MKLQNGDLLNNEVEFIENCLTLCPMLNPKSKFHVKSPLEAFENLNKIIKSTSQPELSQVLQTIDFNKIIHSKFQLAEILYILYEVVLFQTDRTNTESFKLKLLFYIDFVYKLSDKEFTINCRNLEEIFIKND